MSKVVSIYEAKSQLSRLVKRARDGEIVYIGAYGRAEVMLVPVPARRPVPIGVWKGRRVAGFDYASAGLVEPDEDIVADFDAALERDETAD